MTEDRAKVTHDVERVDVSMLSDTQLDMLWMRLRGDDVAYVFDGRDLTVSAARVTFAQDAVAWARREVWSPPRGYYPPLRPFQRTVGHDAIVAARWRRAAAACIDSAFLGVLFTLGARLGMPAWTSLLAGCAYTIATTSTWGCTLGKFLVEIRVVDAFSLEHVTARQSAARWVPLGAIGVAAGLVGGSDKFLAAAQLAIYLPALFDGRGRGLHDRLAGTIVISTLR